MVIFFVQIFIVLSILLGSNLPAGEITKYDYSMPFKQPYVFKKNRPTPELAALGGLLFFDRRLSGDNQMSCATCHRPEKYWSDGLKVGIGQHGIQLRRSTPTLLNSAYNKKQFWDGRAFSLEQQSTMPIESPQEMNQDLDDLVDELKAIRGYVELFRKNFKYDGITRANVSRALAAFQRTLISNDTPFDRWYRGDKNAISESAKRGFALFEGTANCMACHSGFNFTNDKFHNIGLKSYASDKDFGRYEITKKSYDKGSFKTPTLRNVVNTGPYMHNGSIATLKEVIEHYDVGGVANDNLDKEMYKLKLSPKNKEDLLEFLKTLSEDVSIDLPGKFPN